MASTNRVAWELVTDKGPRAAFHAACSVGGSLFIHGGIDKSGSTVALNKLFAYDTDSMSWTDLTTANSPALSHHVAVALHDRYILTIGGWDGRARISNVHVYDIQQAHWIDIDTCGFPAGAGLSSHTANLLSSGDIVIIGREGSLRTQRRTGSAFLLTGDIRKGFEYRSLPLGVSSRSGHSSTIVDNCLYVIGGRDDKLIEIHNGYKAAVVHSCAQLLSLDSCAHNSESNATKVPTCRKNHVAVASPKSILLHGGETFDGRRKGAISDTLLLHLKPHMHWETLITATDIARTGHVGCICGDNMYIHGGFGSAGTAANSHLYRLSVATT